MDEEFRLVFRGEVDDGQHPAVVQKRLAKLLRLDDDKVAQLFSGKATVLRRSVDRATAAQFQSAFKKAGAKLRVQPIRYEAEGSPVADAAPASEPASAADADGLRLLPVGSLLLEVHERLPPVENNVPISHLQLDAPSALESAAADAAPESPVNVDHISVAEVGAQIGSANDTVDAVLDIAVSFELAEDGSWLHDENEDAVVTIEAPDYSLAEPGATMAPTSASANSDQPAPDVSHLSLQDDDSDT